MTQPNQPNVVLLPDALERKQIFHMLKRLSSYTAWKRILGYFQAWADAIERSWREASARGWDDKTSLSQSRYATILRDLAICDEGVTRLRQGDKRVFTNGFNGDFRRARSRDVSYWSKLLYLIETGDSGIDEAHTPYWAEFEQAAKNLFQAYDECSPYILEAEKWHSSAARVFKSAYLSALLARMHFPDPLPEVPEPTEGVLYPTNAILPCSGIWEPVEAKGKKLFSLFNPPPQKGPFPIVGTMNYLHGGTCAPQAKQEIETDSVHTDVTWRLLWRDDRYTDGTVPEEELGYSFLEPGPPKPKPKASALPPAAPMRASAYAGDPCPQTGNWQAPRLNNRTEHVERGQPMPGPLNTQTGAVVW